MKILSKCACDAVGSEVVADCLSRSTILFDLREPSLHAKSHIKGSVNLYISNLLLRRLQRGSFAITSLLTENSLQKLDSNECSSITLYDESSSTENVARGMTVIYSALNKAFPKKVIRFLTGGFLSFSENYSSRCEYGNQADQPNPFRISIMNNIEGCDPTDRKVFSPDTDVCPVSILPHLYLGSAYHSSQKDLLDRLGVTAILNVSKRCPMLFENQYEYKTIPIDDNDRENISSYFDEAIKFIDDVKAKNGKILVHCRAGISRSATICIAYLMRKYGYSLDQAYEYTKKKRSSISPNFNFLGQLLKLESEVSAKRQKLELTLPLTSVISPLKNDVVGNSLSCGATNKAHFTFPSHGCMTYPPKSCTNYVGLSSVGNMSPSPYRVLLTPS